MPHLFLNQPIHALCVICTISIGSFDDDAVEQLVKESLQMKNFQHRNVMGMLGVCLDAGPALLPYMKNGDLLSYLKSNREELVLSQDEPGDKVYTHVHVCNIACIYAKFDIIGPSTNQATFTVSTNSNWNAVPGRQ